LIVTDEAGNRPTSEECDIVIAQMDMIGRPNPLAQFLAGREVKVGESFELPKDVASKVFNLGDKFGEVTRFELTLKKSAWRMAPRTPSFWRMSKRLQTVHRRCGCKSRGR